MPEILQQKLRDSEENYLNTTYWNIYPLFVLVKTGDTENLRRSLDIQLERFPAGRITRDKRKQLEYLTVSLINTFMIAAIQGGVYPPDANGVADEALARLGNARTPAEFPALVTDAAIRLCCMAEEARHVKTGNVHVEKARHYLETHLTQDIRLEDVARSAGLSPYHLSRLFKEATGETMRGYLTKARIRIAKQLLTTTDQSIPQIASLLCFCDQSYFTKVFRQHEGITPREYRERNRV